MTQYILVFGAPTKGHGFEFLGPFADQEAATAYWKQFVGDDGGDGWVAELKELTPWTPKELADFRQSLADEFLSEEEKKQAEAAPVTLDPEELADYDAAKARADFRRSEEEK